MELDIITRAGSWYSYGEERLGQGRENAKEYLTDNPEVALEIENMVRREMNLPVPGEEGSEDESEN